jgi:hypothetical protein
MAPAGTVPGSLHALWSGDPNHPLPQWGQTGTDHHLMGIIAPQLATIKTSASRIARPVSSVQTLEKR